jgi:hypothetical protein
MRKVDGKEAGSVAQVQHAHLPFLSLALSKLATGCCLPGRPCRPRGRRAAVSCGCLGGAVRGVPVSRRTSVRACTAAVGDVQRLRGLGAELPDDDFYSPASPRKGAKGCHVCRAACRFISLPLVRLARRALCRHVLRVLVPARGRKSAGARCKELKARARGGTRASLRHSALRALCPTHTSAAAVLVRARTLSGTRMAGCVLVHGVSAVTGGGLACNGCVSKRSSYAPGQVGAHKGCSLFQDA